MIRGAFGYQIFNLVNFFFFLDSDQRHQFFVQQFFDSQFENEH